MVESEMADLARENGLRSHEVCQGLEDADHSHTRCRLTVPTGGHDAAAPPAINGGGRRTAAAAARPRRAATTP